MLRPLTVLLHRSGLFSYLREQWRADDVSTKEFAAREARKGAAEMRPLLHALQPKQQIQLKEDLADVEKRLRLLTHEVRRLSSILAFNDEHRERRHIGAFDAPRIAAHIADAVQRAEFFTDPAPHMIVERLLPDDTYRAILDAIPPESCFSQRDLMKQNFRPARGDMAPEYSVDAWQFFEREIVDAALLPALVRRFQPHIETAYRDIYGAHADAIAALPLHATRGRLMLRRPGYHLDPHLDPRRVIVTCLTYFAFPGDNARFGTQFFRINQPPAIDRTSTFFPEAHGYSCELVRSVPFTPNTAVAFLNHNVAHGAGIPETAPKATRRYAYQFYVSPDPQEAAAIVGGPVEDE